MESAKDERREELTLFVSNPLSAAWNPHSDPEYFANNTGAAFSC